MTVTNQQRAGLAAAAVALIAVGAGSMYLWLSAASVCTRVRGRAKESRSFYVAERGPRRTRSRGAATLPRQTPDTHAVGRGCGARRHSRRDRHGGHNHIDAPVCQASSSRTPMRRYGDTARRWTRHRVLAELGPARGPGRSIGAGIQSRSLRRLHPLSHASRRARRA